MAKPVTASFSGSDSSIRTTSPPPCCEPDTACTLAAHAAAPVHTRIGASAQRTGIKIFFSSINCPLLQIKRCHSFHPISGGILNNFPQLDTVLFNLNNAAIVLAQIITYTHLINQLVDPQQSNALIAFFRLPTMVTLSSG